LEGAGADGIELNILIPGTDAARAGSDVERAVVEVAHQVVSQVSVPVAVKIGSSYASLANMVSQLVDAGVKGLVLFNRYHQPDMDLDSLTLKHASPFSDPREMHLALRWIGLLAGNVEADFAASTGIHQAEQVVKQLLAGATVTQLCSTLYKNGMTQLGTVVAGLEQWMDQKGYGRVDEFRGTLSHQAADSAAVYERRQYIKHLVGIQ
jgi:dihydroorotate dehydrogenase (fumarate)